MKVSFLAEEIKGMCRVFRHIPIIPSSYPIYTYLWITVNKLETKIEYHTGAFHVVLYLQGYCSEEGECLIPVRSISIFDAVSKRGNSITLTLCENNLIVERDIGDESYSIPASSAKGKWVFERKEKLWLMSEEECCYLSNFRLSSFNNQSSAGYISEQEICLRDLHHLVVKPKHLLAAMPKISHPMSFNCELPRLIYAVSMVEKGLTVFSGTNLNNHSDCLFFHGNKTDVIVPSGLTEPCNWVSIPQNVGTFPADEWKESMHRLVIDKRHLMVTIQFDQQNAIVTYKDKIAEQKMILSYSGAGFETIHCNIRYFKEMLKVMTGQVKVWNSEKVLYIQDDAGLQGQLAKIIK